MVNALSNELVTMPFTGGKKSTLKKAGLALRSFDGG